MLLFPIYGIYLWKKGGENDYWNWTNQYEMEMCVYIYLQCLSQKIVQNSTLKISCIIKRKDNKVSWWIEAQNVSLIFIWPDSSPSASSCMWGNNDVIKRSKCYDFSWFSCWSTSCSPWFRLNNSFWGHWLSRWTHPSWGYTSCWHHGCLESTGWIGNA